MNTLTESLSSHDKLYKVIFPLLRTTIWGKEAFPFHFETDINWDSIYQELQNHAIHHLPINLLIEADTKNSMQYYKNAATALRRWHKLMQEQQTLYTLFKAEGIPFVILKGAAADYYYPTPAYRCMGDIDFIVKPEDFDRAANCLEKNGYQRVDENHPRHNEYVKNEIDFELHRTFAALPDKYAADWIDHLIYKEIDLASEQTIEEYSFPMLPVLTNGLTLLIHMNHHMETGLGLRQIIDWMLYVDKELSDEFWNTTFCSAAEKIGLKTLAISVTKMCQIYLGLSKELTWCQDADDSLCEYLKDYVLEQGNFGRKRGKKQNTALRALSIKNIPALFSFLQSRGENNWTATKKYPVLKPFAWIYQIGRYIHLGFQRDKPLKQLQSDYLKSQQQDAFLDQLEVIRYADKSKRTNKKSAGE